MDKTQIVDTIFITHDSNTKLLTRGKEINIISNRIDTQAITLQNEQIKVIIAKMPEEQPMITDWLAAIGTILAVVISLVFSGLALKQAHRRNFVKIKSVTMSGVGYPKLETIQLQANIINDSSVPLEVYRLWFKYNKQLGPLFPVFFKPIEEKVTILPLNSKIIAFNAFKYDVRPLKSIELRCNSFLEMAHEAVSYLAQHQGAVKNKLKINKKDFRKVLLNLNVGITTNIDTEGYFSRKLTKTEMKYISFRIIKYIDNILVDN